MMISIFDSTSDTRVMISCQLSDLSFYRCIVDIITVQRLMASPGFSQHLHFAEWSALIFHHSIPELSLVDALAYHRPFHYRCMSLKCLFCWRKINNHHPCKHLFWSMHNTPIDLLPLSDANEDNIHSASFHLFFEAHFDPQNMERTPLMIFLQ